MERRGFYSRHHLGRRTVVGVQRLVGFTKNGIEASVLWILSDAFLKVLNRFVHALPRAFSELMQPQQIPVVALEVDMRACRGVRCYRQQLDGKRMSDFLGDFCLNVQNVRKRPLIGFGP